MMGPEMKRFRESLKMDKAKFGQWLGFTGLPKNNAVRVKRIEKGRDPVPLYLAKLIWLSQVWMRRTGELPPFPDWPYYVYDHAPDPGHEKVEEHVG
jgi:hypothetical protein